MTLVLMHRIPYSRNYTEYVQNNITYSPPPPPFKTTKHINMDASTSHTHNVQTLEDNTTHSAQKQQRSKGQSEHRNDYNTNNNN
jgi:hypothetical protein